MLPPGFDLDRVEADVRYLVEEIGPRPFESPAELEAAAWVAGELQEAGWAPQRILRPSNPVACRGNGRRVLLAHLDSVPGSPGAVDNAAGVALLLELSRTTPATDLCLAFPDGEEFGLQGSGAMVRSVEQWHPDPSRIELALSTELLGQGELALMGLGRRWDEGRLRWLVRNLDPLPQVPFSHRVYSRLLPRMERSDHAWWDLALEVPSALLFGRGPSGAFVDYHQPGDTRVDREALETAALTLSQLATAPPLPSQGQRLLPDASTILGGRVLPGWLSWTIIGAGILSGLLDGRRLRELPGQLLRWVPATLGAGLAMLPFTTLGILPSAPAETTAAATALVPASGWWWGVYPALLAGLGAFLLLRRLLGPRGSAPLAAGLMALLLVFVDPLLALGYGGAALLARLHPLLAMLPAFYLLRPEALQELAFHGLLPPWAWGGLWLLAWSGLGGYPPAPAQKPPPPAAQD